MIRYYRKTEKTKLRELDKYESGTWIYVEAPDSSELAGLTELLKLDSGHLSDALDEDEMPRMEREDTQLYVFTRFPFTNEELRLETSPILFVVTQHYLVTIATRAFPRLEKFLTEEVNFSTTEPDQLMLHIISQIVEQYDDLLNQTSRQIKSIRSRLRVERINNEDFIDFVLVEDELNDILAALTPTNAILRRILINKHLHLTEADKELIEDLILSNEQSIESAKSNNKSITNIREAYSTIMTNNLNAVIRVLTVLTVVMSVLTFIAGVYGMNIPLPFGDFEHIFSVVIGGSIMIILILLLIFRRKKWL